MARIERQRIVNQHRGIVVSVNTPDLSVLRGVARNTADMPNLGGYAIGPASTSVSGIKAAVAAITEIAQERAVVYWHTTFDDDRRFETGAVLEPSLIWPLKEGGVSAAIGYLKHASAEKTIQSAMEAGLKIIFAGHTEEGYLFALRHGIMDFLIGREVSHIRRMAEITPAETNLWILSTSADSNLTVYLPKSLRDRPVQLITPARISDSHVAGETIWAEDQAEHKVFSRR